MHTDTRWCEYRITVTFIAMCVFSLAESMPFLFQKKGKILHFPIIWKEETNSNISLSNVCLLFYNYSYGRKHLFLYCAICRKILRLCSLTDATPLTSCWNKPDVLLLTYFYLGVKKNKNKTGVGCVCLLFMYSLYVLSRLSNWATTPTVCSCLMKALSSTPEYNRMRKPQASAASCGHTHTKISWQN